MGLRVILMAFVFANLLWAATPPEKYLSSTAEAKRLFHLKSAESSRYEPTLIGSICSQGIALSGIAVSQKLLGRTLKSDSGYPDDLWRKVFGKGIHSVGVTAPGTLLVKSSILGLAEAEHPVTYRYSLANPYLPLVPGARQRPGFLVIIHRDGAEDLNLFMMPKAGLRGFRPEVNPFDLIYTNWLDKPGLLLRLVAAATFGRQSRDPYTQFLDGNLKENFDPRISPVPDRATSFRIHLHPNSLWREAYEEARGNIFWERMVSMPHTGAPTRLFEVVRVEGEANAQYLAGEMTQDGPWIASRHGDAWFAQHKGFILRACPKSVSVTRRGRLAGNEDAGRSPRRRALGHVEDGD